MMSGVAATAFLYFPRQGTTGGTGQTIIVTKGDAEALTGAEAQPVGMVDAEGRGYAEARVLSKGEASVLSIADADIGLGGN